MVTAPMTANPAIKAVFKNLTLPEPQLNVSSFQNAASHKAELRVRNPPAWHRSPLGRTVLLCATRGFQIRPAFISSAM